MSPNKRVYDLTIDDDDRKLKPAALLDLTNIDDDEDLDQKTAAVAVTNVDEDYDDVQVVDQDHALFGVAEVAHKRRRRVFDCAICLEPIMFSDGISLEVCNHWFCKECLQHYIGSKLHDKSHTMKCPEPSCRSSMTVLDVRRATLLLGNIMAWNKYQELLTVKFLDHAIVDTAQHFRRCPGNRCNYVFDYTPSSTGQLFLCPSCDQGFCLNCQVVGGNVGPAHDETCEFVLREIEASKEKKRKLEEWKTLNSQADEKFNELIRKEQAKGLTKPCPNCRVAITKNQGCNHMHCTQCNKDYNWSDC